MDLNNLLSILYVIFVFSFGYVSAQKCGEGTFFRPNDTYDRNRRLVLSTFGTNVSSRDGYYNYSVGEGPERFYALGLCIPKTDPKVCSDCIQNTSLGLLQNCPNQIDAFHWRADKTLCFVRYSNYSFFDMIELQMETEEPNTGSITQNITEFTSMWDDFMGDMIAAASSSTPGSPAGKHYAADVSHPRPGLPRIYAQMQCTPGLTSVYCDACLQANVRDYKDCCGRNTGGIIQRPPCYFRWDVHPFLNVFDNKTTPSPQSPQGSQTISPVPPPVGKKISRGSIVAIVVSSALFIALLSLGFVSWKRRDSHRKIKLKTDDDIAGPESLQFDFKTIEDATNKFARDNKVGEGGFGEVYKGTFPNGTEVAVKRLLRNSGQGTQEFKNEVAVVAKLQHRNLVRLLGFCLEGDEKILVYEFVPNKSLDYVLFDPSKRWQLNWTRRYNIIEGIVRGILYLHQDSRLKIIHRDLKASNVLLDDDMNSKIADFGTARIFGVEQTRANTGKIAGTFGYMAPEYAMHGLFSMKSDVYSFGVLVLEIISGKKNSSFYQTDGSAGNLVTHAWRLWRKGVALELLDPTFGENYQSDQVTRCIHIALLCVQEDPEDRPMMSTIILLLTSTTITLQVPRPPGFFFQSSRDREPEAQGSNLLNSEPVTCSTNDVTITELDPR